VDRTVGDDHTLTTTRRDTTTLGVGVDQWKVLEFERKGELTEVLQGQVQVSVVVKIVVIVVIVVVVVVVVVVVMVVVAAAGSL